LEWLSASLLGVALALTALTLAAIGWSVLRPGRSIWPPQSYGPKTPIFVWGITAAFFGAVIALGIIGWGDAPIASWLRYVLGPLLIFLGNLAVWSEVIQFGLPQTGGAAGQLKVDGLYRYSRNPQYIADIAILVGWALLSASVVAFPAIVGGIAVLLAAPLPEEAWLENQYGDAYLDYKASVRRYL
tara:strand:- start:535 stop:1092 length:558 start_codon:yes stop_codon:yes gene_type:complete